MTQREKILLMLREAGEKGINSYTRWSFAFQLPTRIFELKKQGLDIESKREKNGSVTYVLRETPKPILTWEFTDGVARQVEVNQKPEQLQIL